jgi:hypothetical protein
LIEEVWQVQPFIPVCELMDRWPDSGYFSS